MPGQHSEDRPLRIAFAHTSPSAIRHLRRGLAGIAGLTLLAGCSLFEAPPQARGNRVDAEVLKELTPGTSTRADATALLGSPTAKATFDDNQWIYIGELTRPQIARTQGVLSQDVVLLTFSSEGVLRDVKRMNQDDGLPVDVVGRATPSPGSEASVLQQLLGNVGRFNPGGVGSSGGASGTTSPGGGGIPTRSAY